MSVTTGLVRVAGRCDLNLPKGLIMAEQVIERR